jgi:hypothetical protein
MKGVLNAPDGKRPHSQARANRKAQRQALKRHFVRHEGLVPARYQKARNRFGLFVKRAYSGQSQQSACLFPGLGVMAEDDKVRLFRAVRLAAARSDE